MGSRVTLDHMRVVCLGVMSIAVSGCAQIAGLDKTRGAPVDAPAVVDSSSVDAAIDARICAGGDARMTDPATGACYVLFTTPATRDAARQSCLSLGPGTLLAGIDSAAENATITSLIGATIAFVGGSDEAVEGTFVWEGGMPLTFTNWNTGEPNNGLNMYEEDCIVISGGLGGVWDDKPCAPPPVGAGAYAFVCEHP